MVHKVYSKCENSGHSFRFVAAAVVLSGVLTACSADISRFNFNEDTTTGALPSSSSTTPPEPIYSSPSGLGRSGSDQPYNTVERNDLSDPRMQSDRVARQGEALDSRNSRTYSPTVPPVAYDDPPRQPSVINTQANVSRPAPTQPETITVRRGDTLYRLSRRHGTTVTALMDANGLSSSSLKPGQLLRLPTGATPSATSRTAQYEQRAPVTAREAPTHWTDTYTIERGDSLYRLSRRYNVKIADLQRYNSISNPRAIKPGMVIKVPGPGGNDGTIAASNTPRRTVKPRSVRSHTIAGSPTILNSSSASGPAQETQVAAAKPAVTSDANGRSGQSVTVRPNDDVRNTIAGSAKLRWPVRGRVISSFGKRNDGTHNDGINVAVPLGTKIHAAESGMVAYAGDDLKGYGNLVLIRHDNGWVTAYAHAEKLLVKRGDRIRRGDVIARAGKTGEVSQPQLHFEVRQGQKPVDPIPFMDRL